MEHPLVMAVYPQWLHALAWAYLILSFISAALILLDEVRRPQKMMIMSFVWPITALYFGPLAVWGYLKSGRKMTRRHDEEMRRTIRAELESESGGPARQSQKEAGDNREPSREQVAASVSHCGAGCTLGDIAAEWWVFLMGLTFAGGAFPTRLLLDFLLAWSFGIVFQYATIVPMRHLSFGDGVWQAIRADTLSIVTFELGLFAWMALSHYVLFPAPHLEPNEAVFWFMMQIGMILGFFTSYPANRFLIRKGWKEKMPQSEDELRQRIRNARQGRAA